MSPVRALYAAAAALGLLAVFLRLAHAPLPRAEAAALPRPASAQPPAAAAGAPAALSYEAVAAANIFSQTRNAPRLRFSPPGRGGGRAAAPAPRAPALTLYGITVGPEGAVALIDADPKIPGAEIYRVGDLVAGAPLVAITDSTVTLAEPSGPLILRLQSARRKQP